MTVFTHPARLPGGVSDYQRVGGNILRYHGSRTGDADSPMLCPHDRRISPNGRLYPHAFEVVSGA